MRFTTLALATCLLAVSTAAHAVEFEFTPPTKTLAPELTGKYELDKSHANILFTISHLGYSGYIGRFNTFDATLDFDAADVTKSKVNATIHTGSIDTNNDVLEAKLGDKDFFNQNSFPVATFTSTQIEKTGADTGIIRGDLTLLGVTKPVVLQAVFNGGGKMPMTGKPTIGFSATTNFKRSDFGMNAYVPVVGDVVTLTIEAEFGKIEAK